MAGVRKQVFWVVRSAGSSAHVSEHDHWPAAAALQGGLEPCQLLLINEHLMRAARSMLRLKAHPTRLAVISMQCLCSVSTNRMQDGVQPACPPAAPT